MSVAPVALASAHRHRVALVVVLAGLAALAPASRARADAPVTLGTGQTPRVAVDRAGTAHFVWAANNAAGNQRQVIEYCRIPTGANACQGTQQITSLGLDFSRPYVFVRPADQAVVIVDSRCCGGDDPGGEASYAIISTDGGTTFAPPVKIGQGVSQFDDMRLSPGGATVDGIVGGTGHNTFQRGPLAGPAGPGSINLDLNPDGSDSQNWYYGQIAYLADGRPMVVMGDLHNLVYRVYGGAGDLYAQSSWTPIAAAEANAESDALAYGPSGVWMAYVDRTPGFPDGVRLAGFTGTGFSAPVNASPTASGRDPALGEDATGRLHLIFATSAGLFYRTFTAAGASNPVAVFSSTTQTVFHPEVGVNDAGAGWAVWDDNGATGSAHAVRLPATTGGGGSGGGSSTGTQHSITVGDTVLTLISPSGCVAPGTIVARLSVRRAHRKTRTIVVKVASVDFYVDRRRVKTVRRAPFRATLVLRGLARGSRHSIRAKIHLKVHHGPARSRSIVNNFTICS